MSNRLRSIAWIFVWVVAAGVSPARGDVPRQPDCPGYPWCSPDLGPERQACVEDAIASIETCLADPRLAHTEENGVWRIVGTGDAAARPGSDPDTLVVFAHGRNQTVEESWCHHVRRVLDDHPEVVVAATNYRDNCGFPALRGAEDVIDLTKDVIAARPSIGNVVLLGVSMGGAISGTAVAEAVEDGNGLFDYWIDVEGVAMFLETWTAAKAAAPETAAGMERDAAYPGADPTTCCTPLQDAPAYVRRSPALRTGEMASGGLRGASVVHGANDGLVPYDQAREMAAALVAAGVPTRMVTVLRSGEEWDHSDDETRGTGYVTEPIEDGTADETGEKRVEDPVRLAGHGWEKLPEHPLMRAAFEELDRLLDGGIGSDGPRYEEIVLDER